MFRHLVRRPEVMTPAVLILTAALAAFSPQGDGIIRLKPRDFRQLPSAVRKNLEKRGCTVPQYPGGTAPHNVINGSFIAKGSRDWAVLCSIKGVSRILVYRGGSAKRVDSLASHPDAGFMQRTESGVVQFSRKIEIATPKIIADRAKASGMTKPPPVDHHAIEDGSLENVSTIHYYYRAKWRELPEAD
jgi:hypothetical protein